MTLELAITISVAAGGFILSLMTAAFRVANAINKSTAANLESRAELTASNKALQRSLDEFKQTSRAEHAEFHRELEEDSKLLAKQGAQIVAHEKTLNNHENRLTILEGRK